MLNDNCGIILTVDNENEIPANPTIGKLYFAKNTKNIIGNLDGNGTIKYSDSFINRPDLWTPSIEYDFGNGLYGQRFSGGYAITANTYAIIGLTYLPLNSKIIECGGYINQNNNDFQQQLGGSRNGPNNANYQTNTLNFDPDNGVLHLFMYDNTSSSNNLYNVWVKYTK
jgi:hypothetical protein